MRSLYKKTLMIVLVASVLFILLPVNSLSANDGSTTLVIEPEIKRVSPLDLEQGLGRFSVDLHLSNVQDLTWFKFTLVFDGDILAPIPGEWHGDPTSWSHGGTSSGSCGYGSYTVKYYEIKSPSVSGSGILLSYWFYPKMAGVTTIEFKEAELRDSNGDVIPCTFIGNEVEVLSPDTWSDGEYAELSTEYDELQTQYTDLEAKHETLSGEYSSLNSSYNSLEEDYSSLNEEYITLEADHASLNEEYITLESGYDDLTSKHQSTVKQLEETNNQLDTTRILMYGFIGLTVVFMSTTVLIIVRRKRYHG